MTEIKLTVKGMHCKSCEIMVKEALEEIDGVKKASASFKDNLVTVSIDEKKVKVDALKKAIKNEGYDAA